MAPQQRSPTREWHEAIPAVSAKNMFGGAVAPGRIDIALAGDGL